MNTLELPALTEQGIRRLAALQGIHNSLYGLFSSNPLPIEELEKALGSVPPHERKIGYSVGLDEVWAIVPSMHFERDVSDYEDLCQEVLELYAWPKEEPSELQAHLLADLETAAKKRVDFQAFEAKHRDSLEVMGFKVTFPEVVYIPPKPSSRHIQGPHVFELIEEPHPPTQREPMSEADQITRTCDELKEAVLEAAPRLVDEIKELLLEKNAAYGNSALDPVRIFSKADPIEQIKVRLDDKLSRIARGSNAGEDVEVDLIGYIVFLRIARGMVGP